ncbi:MAG: sigma-70 family RNA polymerase sigma factor [Planctomycetota bacterium]|nr:sigma-70 family RNA polymerase sigma factor [Planctomycetota bacterium]
MQAPSVDITHMLRRASSGDPAAVEQLAPIVMHELRAIADRAMKRETPGHTLQPTLLANEAFMRLVGNDAIDWSDRSHFFALAARNIRRILVDHARARSAQKRGGGPDRLARVTLDFAEGVASRSSDLDVTDVDDALTKLAALDPRQAQVVELRFFGGLTSEQTAQLLGVSKRTVDEDWAMARAWLSLELHSH